MSPQGPPLPKPKPIIAGKNLLYGTLLLIIIGFLMGEFSEGWPGLIVMMITIGLLITVISLISLGRKWVRPVLLILIIIELHAALSLLPFFFSNSLVLGFLFVIQVFLQIRALVLLYSGESNAWFDRFKNKAGVTIEAE